MSALTLTGRPHPRSLTAIDLVVPAPGAGELVAELTAYGESGCPRSVLHLPLHPDRVRQLSIASRAAHATWGVALGPVVQEVTVDGRTVLRFAPTAL